MRRVARWLAYVVGALAAVLAIAVILQLVFVSSWGTADKVRLAQRDIGELVGTYGPDGQPGGEGDNADLMYAFEMPRSERG